MKKPFQLEGLFCLLWFKRASFFLFQASQSNRIFHLKLPRKNTRYSAENVWKRWTLKWAQWNSLLLVPSRLSTKKHTKALQLQRHKWSAESIEFFRRIGTMKQCSRCENHWQEVEGCLQRACISNARQMHIRGGRGKSLFSFWLQVFQCDKWKKA